MMVVAEKLRDLAALEHDWDSYGALPPTSTSLANAQAFADAVEAKFHPVVGNGALPYFIAPIADGGVGLDYLCTSADSTVEMDVFFGPEGGLCYLLVEKMPEGRRSEETYDVPEQDVIELVGWVIGARADRPAAPQAEGLGERLRENCELRPGVGTETEGAR